MLFNGSLDEANINKAFEKFMNEDLQTKVYHSLFPFTSCTKYVFHNSCHKVFKH